MNETIFHHKIHQAEPSFQIVRISNTTTPQGWNCILWEQEKNRLPNYVFVRPCFGFWKAMVMNHESVKMKQQKRPNSLNDTGSQLQFFTIYRLILSYMWQANSSKPTQLISIGHQRSPLKIGAPWKRRFLLETIIFRGEHVSFREISLSQRSLPSYHGDFLHMVKLIWQSLNDLY